MTLAGLKTRSILNSYPTDMEHQMNTSITWSIAVLQDAGFTFKRVRGCVMAHRVTFSGTYEAHLLTSREDIISLAESIA